MSFNRCPHRTGSSWLRAGLLGIVALAGSLSPPAAAATEFLATLGFEDDVDLVVSPNREFMVVPEESEDGASARLRILDLDPASGEYVAILDEYDEGDGILGFENGVDPMIISQPGAGGAYLILVPVENESGTEAKVIQFLTDDHGVVLDRVDIDLGDLGFRVDVDAVWDTYNVVGSPAVAFFVLESEDHSVRGVLAIDADNGDGDWGVCNLLSTDGRAGCGDTAEVDWLPGLADGVDPIAYSAVGGFVDLWLPVTGVDGTSDLLFLQFDSDAVATNVPPGFTGQASVKETNAAGARPTPFPGYERDVDLVLHVPAGGGYSLLVPVEGPGDVADLYRINSTGVADWIFSLDSGGTDDILGYEAGVDLMVRGDLVPPRVVVPVENAAGSDADLYFVNLEFGNLLARAEAANPGLVLPGWEIGVDLTQWTDDFLVAPVEGAGGAAEPGLLAFRFNGVVASGILGHQFMGFQRSVDPIVVPYEPNPILVVPFGRDDGSDADIYAYFFPPNLGGGVSLESIHPGLELSQFEWDVDLGVVDNLEPGAQHLCVPEEAPGGAGAQLRFEPISLSYPRPLLVVATEQNGDLPATLYLVDVNTGNLALEVDDLLGLETGLDMVNARGPVTGPVPEFTRPTGADRDGDPTLAWAVAPAGARDQAVLPAGPFRLSHPNPFAPPERIRIVLPSRSAVRLDIVDVAGRRVRRLLAGERGAGEHAVVWDGRDDRGARMPAGIYFLEGRGAGARALSKLVLID